jgi:trypsin
MSASISNIAGAPGSQDFAPPPRIVGGYDVNPAFKYPTMATLQRNGVHDCGGTFWNGNTIITAAHCTYGAVEKITVKIHRHDLSKTDKQEKGQTYKVISMKPHPKYVKTAKGYDVAIWKLDAPAGNRTNVELDDGTFGNDEDALLTGIGWGSTLITPSPNILQEVKLPVYNFDQCMKDYEPLDLSIDNRETQLCAGFPEGKKDACQRDSGGPLFTIKEGKQILVGIVSYGKGCALASKPGVYARVSNLKDWILENI